MEDKYKNLKLAEKGVRISIIAYVVLAVLKIVVGYLSNSNALKADGFNNTTDIIGSLAVLIGLRLARRPPDEDHPYGHLRIETISSLVASLIMIAVGIDVLYNSVHTIVYLKAKAPDLIAALAAIISSASMYIVYRYNKKIAIQTNSSGLMASAKDNRSDAWVGLGTTVGIIASQFGLSWVDSFVAILVGLLIIKTGWDIFNEASHILTDGFCDEEKLNNITEKIKSVSGVKKVKGIRARIHGSNILLDIIVVVSADISVTAGHSITEKIEEMLRNKLNITEAIIHVEPEI